jgi:hypothetical protein
MSVHDRLRLWPILSLVIAAVAAIATLPAGSQQRIEITGTLVTLTAPPGFRARERGLEDAAGSSITISERPAEDYAELAELFASPKNLTAAYASQGVTVRAGKQLAAPAGRVLFASGHQSFRGKESVKYFALLKGDKTVLVTFTIVDRMFSEADAEAVVSSIELKRVPTVEEQVESLPFTFRAVEPFRVTAVQPRTAVTLVAGDRPDALETPRIVIGRAPARVVMGQESQVAVELLKGTSGYGNATVTSEAPAPFVGGTGYLVSAAVDDRTVMQYLRVVPGGFYMRMLVRGGTAAIEDLEAVIEEIAASVALE